MAPNQFSSGDVIADRRADYARMLAEGGDYPAAAELMEQALELAPRWTAGWFRFGEYHEKAGETDKAVAAYEKVAEMDEEGLFAAELKLAVLGAAETPEQPPSRYVEGLFDDYADRFETSLVEKLDYSVPQKLAELIEKAHIRQARRIKTKPSRAAKAKRVDTKKARSAVKEGRGKVRLD